MEPLVAIAHINFILNVVAALAVITAFRRIRAGNKADHKRFIFIGMGASAVFLVFFVFYHVSVGFLPFRGEGWVRPAYQTLLATHVFMAVVIGVLIPITAWHALRGRFEQHRRLVRWTLPAWLYVSLTGVVIYFVSYWLV